MKQAGKNKRKAIKIVGPLISCFFLCLSGCGLDSYPYLISPTTDRGGNVPYYDSSDYLQKYFCFYTSDSSNSNDGTVTFRGTEIYYKIFNNSSTMISYRSTVQTLVSNGDYTSAAERIIDTQGYKTLKLSTGSITPLIKSDGTGSKYVYIRLTDYQNSESFKAGICVNNSNSMKEYDAAYALKFNGTIVYPRRNVNAEYTFNFGGDNTDTDIVPASTDEDVCYSTTTTEEGTWYVQMYALSVGIDTSTWTSYYSAPLLIGSVTIVEGGDN